VFIVPPPFLQVPHDAPVSRAILLRGPRLADGQVADVLIADGTIASVGRGPAGHPPRAEILDLRGYLLLPSLVDPHAHLGTVFAAPGVAGGSPADGSGGAIAARHEPRGAGIAALARAAATRHLACGTTAIRVHVDVGEATGLRTVEALIDMRAGLARIMDIHIVAVTSAQVTGLAGADSRARLRHALAAGADLAGVVSAPGDETGHAVEAVAVVAADAGAGLDLRVGENAPGTLPRLVAVAEAGFGYPVTASHVVSLGRTLQERSRAARSLAEAGIGVVALPRPGMVRCGGGLGTAGIRGLTAVRDLVEAGVPVAAGGDGPQELSHADPLETASLLLMAARLTPAEALAAVTSAGRQIMRLPDVTLSQGSAADLVAIRPADIGSTVAAGTADRIVLRGGRIVARTQTATEFAPPELRAMNAAWNLPGAVRPVPRPARCGPGRRP